MSETLRMPPEGVSALLEQSIAPCDICGTPTSWVTVERHDGGIWNVTYGVDTGASRVTRIMEAVQDSTDPCLFHLSPHECTPAAVPVAELARLRAVEKAAAALHALCDRDGLRGITSPAEWSGAWGNLHDALVAAVEEGARTDG